MSIRHAYSDGEWGQIVGLPQSIMLAAVSVEDDSAARTFSEGGAGLDAIAAGLDSGSSLVHDVAAELTTRLGDPETGELPPTLELGDARVDSEVVLDQARTVTDLLTAKAGPGEAAAYRQWVIGIADQVVHAAKSGGFLGIGGEWVSDSEHRFMAQLTEILND